MPSPLEKHETLEELVVELNQLGWVSFTLHDKFSIINKLHKGLVYQLD